MNGPAIKTITAQQLHELSQRQPVELIDVRTPEEFREVRAALARNVPLDTLDPAALVSGRNPEHPIYFICHMGGRSAHACLAAMAAGFANAVNVEGGTDAWLQAGLPVTCDCQP